MPRKRPDPAEEQAAQRAAVRLLASAYRAVFGRDGARTPQQELVWDDMQRRAYMRRPTMVADAKGQVCALRMAQAEGQRIFQLQTEQFIARASESDEPTQPPMARKE